MSLIFSKPEGKELSTFFELEERSQMSALAISASKQQIWTSLKGVWHGFLFEKNWGMERDLKYVIVRNI